MAAPQRQKPPATPHQILRESEKGGAQYSTPAGEFSLFPFRWCRPLTPSSSSLENADEEEDPGLVYELTIDDYLSFLCAQDYNETQIKTFTQGPFKCPNPINFIDINLPSITVPNLNGSVTVTRTLKNVGSPATYKARIRRPVGISVVVEPNVLEFKKIGEEKSFKITLKVKGSKAPRDYSFGQLIWSDSKHYVRSPIVVKCT